jgi:flagellin-like hook-associated protein FlgL
MVDDETAPLPDPMPQAAPDQAPVPGAAEPEPVPHAAPDHAPVPAAAEPEPVPTPAATPAAQPAVAAAKAGGGHRGLGLAAQVVGVIGIVLCLVLAVGVIVGRGWATDTVSQVSTSIDSQVARAVPLLDTASGKVSEVSGRVGALADAATALAGRPNPSNEVLQGLMGALTNVSDRYLELRAKYGELKATVTSALDRLQMLDRLIPGFSIPQGPVDALANLDAAVTDLDAKIMGIAGAIPETGPIDAAATAVATKATEVKGKLDGLVGVIDDAQTRLTDLRAKLASTTDTIRTAISIGSLGLVLLLLYFAFLHWVLFRTGRQMRRESAGA